jgi:hypothetical protein
MVFCYSDVWLENFFLSDEGLEITVVDFSESSFLPSSFVKYVLSSGLSKIGRDISELVVVPTTEGVDNTTALHAVHGPMIMGWGSFVNVGRRLFGEQPSEDDRNYEELLDEHGKPVMIPRQEQPTRTSPKGLPPLPDVPIDWDTLLPPPPRYLPRTP